MVRRAEVRGPGVRLHSLEAMRPDMWPRGPISVARSLSVGDGSGVALEKEDPHHCAGSSSYAGCSTLEAPCVPSSEYEVCPSHDFTSGVIPRGGSYSHVLNAADSGHRL
eukprot:3042045-Pyramimonas_sp.AAC.1